MAASSECSQQPADGTSSECSQQPADGSSSECSQQPADGSQQPMQPTASRWQQQRMQSTADGCESAESPCDFFGILRDLIILGVCVCLCLWAALISWGSGWWGQGATTGQAG